MKSVPGTRVKRNRLGALRVVVLMSIAFAAAGCSVGLPSRASVDDAVEIKQTDGFKWLSTDMTDYYRCEVGLLICQSAIGRSGDRLCRCTSQ